MISNSVYEDSEKGTITQESAVKTLENSLKLIPTNRKLLLAKIKQMEAALENKKLQLSYTEVKMPFEGRISAVNVEKSEYIQTGKTLIETSGTDIVEIEANFSREVSRLLFSGLVSKSVSKIKAIVRPAGADSETFWKAEFKRISGEIDPETRTIEVTVQIKFQDNGIKSSKNLLIPGTYCEVILQGNADPNRIVIPRSALHENNSVYILDEKQKLKKTQVKIDYKIGNLYVIESGIVPEETVILTDVVPAINGMKLTPKLDTDRVARLKKEARGNLL